MAWTVMVRLRLRVLGDAALRWCGWTVRRRRQKCPKTALSATKIACFSDVPFYFFKTGAIAIK